jgi:hypothetical protein
MKHEDQTNFENWLHRQTKNLPEANVSAEFLAAQRRSIYRRIDQPQRSIHRMRWALSLAMLLVLFAGGMTFERRHKPAPAISPATSPATSDDQLFSDLSAMEQSNEPRAIQPIHGLFQE